MYLYIPLRFVFSLFCFPSKPEHQLFMSHNATIFFPTPTKCWYFRGLLPIWLCIESEFEPISYLIDDPWCTHICTVFWCLMTCFCGTATSSIALFIIGKKSHVFKTSFEQTVNSMEAQHGSNQTASLPQYNQAQCIPVKHSWLGNSMSWWTNHSSATLRVWLASDVLSVDQFHLQMIYVWFNVTVLYKLTKVLGFNSLSHHLPLIHPQDYDYMIPLFLLETQACKCISMWHVIKEK